MAEAVWDEELSGVEAEEDAKEAQWLLERVEGLADELAGRPNLGLQVAPLRELARLDEMGLLTAPLPRWAGGLGLGIEAGGQRILLRILAAVGGGDLALGRLYEGHVNGLMLVMRYGTRQQVQRLWEDCRAGMLSGVWNTGAKKLLRLHEEKDGVYRFEGVKTFATGGAFVRRPIVTAEISGRGWQMAMVRMDEIDAKIDASFWHPIGMESSESFGVDFSGERVGAENLVGAPGDFYRDPLFRGGAVRFAAVQAGAVLRLHGLFAGWLHRTGRSEDPYQVTRLGEVAILAQEAALWVEKAGVVAEECLFREDWAHTKRMVECANMTRTAIAKIATRTMQRVTEGVGAHGLLQPERFERVIRDLTMYLRQPAPDQTLAEVGRASLGRTDGGGFWSGAIDERSLTPEYFRRVYEQHDDPWEFRTSEYEADKYRTTLESLPRDRYVRALEIGCSIGVLTEKLVRRCESLIALDVSEHALDQARARLPEEDRAQFLMMRFPHEAPDGRFDLVVVSEVAYYWGINDLKRAADRIATMQEPGGHLVLVHWIPRVHDYPLTGDAVHAYWISRREWRTVRSIREEKFRLEVLERV